MKKLTKVLSLVLVIAMIVSLCVVGVSAKTFTDTDKVTNTYAEAVDVVSDLGIVTGTSTTSSVFNAAGNFTRAEACVMLAKATLGDKASALAPNTLTFKDVPASFWGYKYIEYCANAGLVAGTGNGNFSPAATLTGIQFAKMLMDAMGVDTSSIKGGANWAIDTAKLYFKTNFSTVAATNAVITREAAAQMVYDAMFFPVNGKVGYPVYKGTELIAVYDTVAEATMMVNTLNGAAGTTYSTAAVKVAMGSDFLAKTVFGVTRVVGTDTFGRPSNVYTTDTKAQATAYGWVAAAFNIAAKTVASAPVLTYTTAVKPAVMALTLKNAGYTFDTTTTTKTATANAATIVTNGAPVFYNGSEVESYIAGTTEVGGNGCLIEVYANAKNVVNKIVVVNTYVGAVKITAKDDPKTTTADERALTVTVKTGYVYPATVATPGFDAVYTAAAAATAAGKTAYALVTPNDDTDPNSSVAGTKKAVTLAVPEVKTVTPTSFVTGKSFTTADATYQYSKNCVGSVGNYEAQTVLLDSYGYVISATAVSATANFAVVIGSEDTTSWNVASCKARLVMADGSTKEVAVASTASGMLQKVVSYSVTNDVYTLNVVDSDTINSVAYTGTAKADQDLAITKGVAAMTFGGSYVADAQTTFIVRSGAGTTASPYTYASYTGIANMPSMSATGVADGYVVTANSTAKFVYIANATATAATGNAVVFVTGVATESHKLIGTTDTTHYVAKAIVDGSIVDIDMAADYALGVYTVKGTDANGFVTLATDVSTALSSNSVYAIDGKTIVNGGTTYSVANDCAVYTYSAATGEITPVALTDIPANATGCFTTQHSFSATGAEIVNAIYFQVA